MELTTRRSLIVLPLFALVNYCAGISVNIIQVVHENCSYANGSMWATASGGVPPYTFAWDDGPTTALRDSLSASTYSVTVTDAMSAQATDQVTIVSQGYEFYYSATYPYCNAFAVLFSTQGVPGNGPWYFNGAEAIPHGIDMGVDTNYIVYTPGTEGSSFLMTVMDGSGCTGTLSGTAGYLIQYPQVSVLDVQPSCANTNTGSISLHATDEGHQQGVNMILVGEDGYFYSNVITVGPAPVDTVFKDLEPGDYRLTFWLGATVDLLDPGNCSPDTIYITVPDLGPVCGQLTGRVYVDADEDCVMDGSEVGAEDVLLEIQPGPYYALTGELGHYNIALPFGNYTIAQITPQLQQHCVPDPVAFTMSANTTVNLADTSLVPLDMQVSFTNSPARPGFQLYYWIDLDNLTPGPSGSLTLTFQFDPTVSYVTATPAPASVIGNTITWNLPQLSFFQHRDVSVTMQVPSDVGLIGTPLPTSASLVTGNTDADLSNNSASSSVTITGSYDPNDKTARTSSGLSDTQYFLDQDGFIDYTIRFQNTGTDTAFSVVITDTLSAELDMATFQMGAASHAYTVSFVPNASVNDPNRVVEWTFNNILLPDSNANEAASHGAVSFRIQPVQGLLLGTVIENTANIFFDFNPPVITEPSILVVENSTGIQASASEAPLLWPNPVKDVLHFGTQGCAVKSVTLTTADGRIVRNAQVTGNALSVADLVAGVYLLRSHSCEGERTLLFVKE